MTIAIQTASRQLALLSRAGRKARFLGCRPIKVNISSALLRGITPHQSFPYVERAVTYHSYSTKARLQAELAAPKPSASDVMCNNDKFMLEVTWGDSSSSVYPYAFLRDNCRCPKCFLPSSKSRILLMRDFNVNTTPESAVINKKNCEIQITWDDGHESSWTSDWFWNRRFGDEGLEARKKWFPMPIKKWNNEYIKDHFPTYNFSKLMTSDEALYDFICDMETLGLALIHETPTEKGPSQKLADRVAYIKNTHYGGIWQVEAKEDPSNAAYASVAIGLHTDFSYFSYVPGIQMFHCIQQVPTKGGASTFADGFHVADLLKKERPDHFEVLCNTVVDFSDMGSDFVKFHLLSRVPTFRLDDSGEMYSVVFSQQHRDSILTMEAEQVKPLYEAMKYYEELLNKPENQITVKLRPGDFVCVHNHRVLHGREGFEVIGGGERLLEGGYLDWDELHSRRRVLQAELAGINTE